MRSVAACVAGAVFVAAQLPIAAAGDPTIPAVRAVASTVHLPNVTKMLGGTDGWQTPFIVQNVGAVHADVDLDFYSFDGGLVKTRSVTALAPGTSIFHDPNSDADLTPNAQFSVVVRSYGSPVVAVVNQHQRLRDAARQEALSYVGLSGGARTIQLPWITRSDGGWLTTIVIQNLGTGTASVSIRFLPSDGRLSTTLTREIAPGRSRFIDPSVEPALAVGIKYSAVIASDQPLGVIVNAHNDAPGALRPRGFSYNGIPAADASIVYLPQVVRNGPDPLGSSLLVVQNTGPAPASPRVDLRQLGVPQSTSTTLAALAPGQAITLDLRDLSGIADGQHSVALSGGSFVALAITESVSGAMGYTTVAPTTRTYLPNVTRRLGGQRGWTTPIVIQSAGATSAVLRWYRFADGALAHTSTVRFPAPGTAISIDPRAESALRDGSQYGVVIDSVGGTAVSLVTEIDLRGGDGLMAYEGVAASAPARANENIVIAQLNLWYFGEVGFSIDGKRTVPVTPALGRTYWSEDPEVIRQQIDWAAAYGVDAFSLEWTTPRGIGHSLEVQIDDAFLRAPNLAKIRWVIFHDFVLRLLQDPALAGSRSRGLDFDDPLIYRTFVSDLEHFARKYFGHPQYLRIDGRPVLYVYASNAMVGRVAEAVSEARAKVRALGFDVFLVGDEVNVGRPLAAGHAALFDAHTTFVMFVPGLDRPMPDMSAAAREVDRAFTQWRASVREMRVTGRQDTVNFQPGWAPQYDDRLFIQALGQGRGKYVPALSKDQVVAMANVAKSHSEPTGSRGWRLTWINTFNNWAETTTIEPTASLGPKYPAGNYQFDMLEVVREVFGGETFENTD